LLLLNNHNHLSLIVITVVVLVVAASFLVPFLLKSKILNSAMFRSYVLPLYLDKTHKKGYTYSIMAV